MTVYIEKPAVNLREELASLRNQGVYQEQQFYFDSLVTNGTFDAGVTGWNLKEGDGTFTSSANQGVLTYGTVATAFEQNVSVTIGKTYTIVVEYVGGTSTIAQAFYNDTTDAALGTITEPTPTTLTTTVTAQTSSIKVFVRVAASGTAIFDNVSVFETDGTDVIHTMPKGWVPKDVFEDGLLQREGAANDYEVVYDGFDYVIKPAVAPSATTQTCVIGVRK